VAVQREAARHSLGEIAALHRQLTHLLAGVGRADLDLDALGGRLADEDAVVAAHVVHDRLVEAIAADACGVGVHHAIERQYGPLGGPPPMARPLQPGASWTGRPAPHAAAIRSLSTGPVRPPTSLAGPRMARRC